MPFRFGGDIPLHAATADKKQGTVMLHHVGHDDIELMLPRELPPLLRRKQYLMRRTASCQQAILNFPPVGTVIGGQIMLRCVWGSDGIPLGSDRTTVKQQSDQQDYGPETHRVYHVQCTHSCCDYFKV